MSRACYLAGPMRGYENFNFPAFHAAAEKLRQAGWVVFNPAEMDIELDGMNEDGSGLTEVEAGSYESLRRYAHRDTQLLINKLKSENEDAIVLLPRWQESVGARAETGVAQWVQLQVIPYDSGTWQKAAPFQKEIYL